MEASPIVMRKPSPYFDITPAHHAGDRVFPLQMNRIWGTFKRRLWFILISFLLLGAAAVSVVRFWPVAYRAEATLVIAANKVNVIDIKQVMDDLRVDSFTAQTEAAVIVSRPLIEKAVATLGVMEHPELVGMTAAEAAENPQAVRDRFLQNIQVRPGESSRAIQVRYLSAHPVFAAAAANALADAYIQAQIARKSDATQQASGWLVKRAEEQRAKLLESEEKLERYKRDSGIVTFHEGATTAYTEQMAKLNIDLITARNSRNEAQAKAEQISTMLAQPGSVESTAAVLSDGLIRTLRSQEAEVTRKIGELRSQYRDNHPNLKLAKAELEDLQRKIAEEVGKIVVSLKNESELSRVKEEHLSREIEKLRAHFNKEQEATATLRALESEVAAHKELYQLVLNRQNETHVQTENDSQPDAQFVSRATIPTLPYSPNKPLLLAIGLACSLALSLALALILEYRMPGFHNSRQVEEETGLPVLAMLPHLPHVKKGDMPHSGLLHFSYHPLYGESIRTLRANVMENSYHRHPRVVLVTSSVPEESKTSTVYALASLSRTHDQKCLLVDCDLRRSQLARRLGVQGSIGLGDYLSGTADIRDILNKDEKTGVYFISAGKPVHHPLDLLATRRMEHFMEAVRDKFDVVFLDTPPVLSVSDPLVLTKYADYILYMVRWEKTGRDAVKHGVRLLQEKSLLPVGIALSRVDVEKHACYRYTDSDYINFNRYSYIPPRAAA